MTTLDSAFETAASILGQLAKPGDAQLQLDSSVTVVRGEHDRIENLLQALALPFQLIKFEFTTEN